MQYTYLASKSILLTFCSTCLLFATCKKNSQSKATPGNISDTAHYELAWSDEFDGTTIDTANWNFETGGTGWGNHEKEYYQPGNATVQNSNLIITAKEEKADTNSYTSARMTTQGKQEFTYGKVEARIKLPVGDGFWPAFWMLGSNITSLGWPACGETDIMEHINSDSIIYGTVHWDNNGHSSYGKNTASSPSGYHTYSVEWDSAAIRWYVDGTKYNEVNILNNINSMEEFHKPFFILLNLAVGGDWPGQTIDNSKLPANMYVDYVRVFKKK